MKPKNRSRFLLLLNSGVVLMHLFGCAAPATKTVEEVIADPWDRFKAEPESCASK